MQSRSDRIAWMLGIRRDIKEALIAAGTPHTEETLATYVQTYLAGEASDELRQVIDTIDCSR